MNNKRKFITLLCSILFCFLTNVAKAEPLTITDLSESDFTEWEDKIFQGTTSYQLLQLNNQKVLLAESQDSASALIKKIHIDIKEHPYLNWSWRIENRLDTKNEKIKSGDDYAVRIYVVVDGGIFPWRTKAVNYVWANESSKHETWPNAFAGKNAMMMALRNKEDKTSTWYFEKRNIYEDMKRLFGTEFQFIDAIAIMTDTDNSHGQVKAYYGEIYFTTD
jgi:DUF3047 family protein